MSFTIKTVNSKGVKHYMYIYTYIVTEIRNIVNFSGLFT